MWATSTRAIWERLARWAALYRARETGRGESVDIAQYEAVLRSQGQNMMAELNTGNPISHTPFPNAELVAGYGAYECSDGKATAW